MEIKCKVCATKMKVNQFQSRKKICSECAYKLKKLRTLVKYHEINNPNSPKGRFYHEQLKMFKKLIKIK